MIVKSLLRTNVFLVSFECYSHITNGISSVQDYSVYAPLALWVELVWEEE